MPHAALSNYLIGQSPHLLGAPPEYHNLHAPAVIKVDVQDRAGQVGAVARYLDEALEDLAR